jgi:hypothetical protein
MGAGKFKICTGQLVEIPVKAGNSGRVSRLQCWGELLQVTSVFALKSIN